MKKKKATQKCWGVNWDKVDEGAYHSGNISAVYAETRGKAKSMLLSDISDYKLCNGDDIDFINMPIERKPNSDKYDFDGELLTQWEYEEVKAVKKRKNELNKILMDPKITHCYIYKNGSYYSSGWCGYTQFQSKAGVYNKDEAISSAMSCQELKIIPINVDSHNELINSEIESLKTRLIK